MTDYPDVIECPVNPEPKDPATAYRDHWLFQEYKTNPDALREALTQSIDTLTLIRQAITEMEQNKFVADPGSSVNEEKMNIASFMESLAEGCKIIGIITLTSDRLQADDLPKET